jgi:hypothetical protein
MEALWASLQAANTANTITPEIEEKRYKNYTQFFWTLCQFFGIIFPFLGVSPFPAQE